MFLAPAASSICAAVTAMSGIIAFSFSPHVIVIRSTGMPNLSTTVGIDLDEVVEARQHLAEPVQVDRRRADRGRPS